MRVRLCNGVVDSSTVAERLGQTRRNFTKVFFSWESVDHEPKQVGGAAGERNSCGSGRERVIVRQ